MEALSSSSLRWTDRMDNVFIDALMNEVVLGNRVDGSFTSNAYNNIANECSEKMNQPLTKAHLKNRLKTIQKNFNDVFDLFGASGWGWNEVTAMFDNEDEVWESLLKDMERYLESDRNELLVGDNDDMVADGEVEVEENENLELIWGKKTS
ncbi:L10-interacting MYB domain-containing protein-like [Silene latifolia]|uniref:L10-interacting MYB domain-containing protein-like n=1 Tax=Silene latifolia TaxID=37657 RepID=UPI003D776B66